MLLIAFEKLASECLEMCFYTQLKGFFMITIIAFIDIYAQRHSFFSSEVFGVFVGGCIILVVNAIDDLKRQEIMRRRKERNHIATL